MATRQEALAAQYRAFDDIVEMTRVRPMAIGLVQRGYGDYGLKVTLPRLPSQDLPGSLRGVPVEYSVAIEEPALLGGGTPNWRSARG
jgi:hypothetical protein